MLVTLQFEHKWGNGGEYEVGYDYGWFLNEKIYGKERKKEREREVREIEMKRRERGRGEPGEETKVISKKRERDIIREILREERRKCIKERKKITGWREDSAKS